MSLGAHLREARNRLIIAALGVLVGTIVAWIFYDQAFAVLTNPLEVARAHGHNVTVNFGTVLSSFDINCVYLCGRALLVQPRCGSTSFGRLWPRGCCLKRSYWRWATA